MLLVIDQATPISRGAYLATAGDCVACHTKPGGAPFAGGLVIASPMGGIDLEQQLAQTREKMNFYLKELGIDV